MGSGLDMGADIAEQTNPLCISLVFFAVLHVVTKVWKRLVQPYASYPWCLASIIDPRLDEQERSAQCVAFKATKGCCLDPGFSARLQAKLTEPKLLLPGNTLSPALNLLSHQKVLNAEIEDNFARAASMAKCSRGQWSVGLL